MALCGSKKKKCWVWLAVNRLTRRIVAFATGSRGVKTLKKLWQQIAHLPCAYYATDTWRAYPKLLPAQQHLITKKETYTVEAKNAQVRHYLARFHRRTKCYSKSIDSLENSLTLIIQKLNYS